MNRHRLGLLTLASAIAMIAQVAAATETITYEYDARGRLKKVVHTGDVNTNVQTIYNLDKADNRITVTTTGAP
jgi:YD repeat-containing protein